MWPGMIRLASTIVSLGLALSAYAGPSPSPDGPPRHALVIGNSAYRTLPLVNPVNDARAIAQTLEKLGFRVTQLENSSQSAMYEAIRSFGDSLKSGGVGLFYYAGHGVQIKGHNYLLPVDSVIDREDEVAYKAVDAQQILDKMESAKNPLNIVILDACRNNPFARSSRSAAVGLAPMDAPVGSLIAFATAPGAEASDGKGKHGVYTQQLLQYMTQPGLKVEDVFKRARLGVRQATSGKQIPWENTSLEGDFYFVAPTAGTAATATTDPAALETEFWQAIKDSNNPHLYQAYLDRFPRGQFAPDARNRTISAAKETKSESSPKVATANQPSRGNSGFSFSAEEEKMNAAALSVFPPNIPCGRDPRNARIRLEIDEQQVRRGRATSRQAHGALADAIAQRLQKAGLRVTSMGKTDYLLRGTVTAQGGVNRLLALNEVSMNAALTLSRPSGQVVSTVLSREESYAGNDVSSVYFDLIRQQADRVASQLYADLCKGS
jgi:hypothetical protein